MQYREIVTEDIPQLFKIRIATRENRLTIDELQKFGITPASLDTFDFQAKDFYLKHGYEIFGVLKDCPVGHECYYLSKGL